MFLFLLALMFADPPPVAGAWEGIIKVQALIPLRLQFVITADADGKLGGTMRSPDQSNAAIKLGAVTATDGKLDIRVPANGGRFIGTVSPDGKTAKGDWKQSGQSFPMVLKWSQKLSVQNRPQIPKPPFPYRSEEVIFSNPAGGGHILAGTLTLPTGSGRFPAVVLVSGSGPQDRDESLMGHKPFLVLADSLTRRGIAVLRYDDRGVGKSGGQFAGATSADFATDAHAAVQYLLGRREIAPKRVGICGHSEGGLIGPIVAVNHPDDVGFLVLLAGPGLPGDVVSRTQVRDLFRAEGMDEKGISGLLALNSLSLAALKKPWRDPRPVLVAATGGLAGAAKDKWRPKPAGDPWLRFFLSYDPAPTLANVNCPVLALNGGKDLQVAAKENLAAIKAACPQADCRELPGLNHLFQPCKTGGLSEYATIETTLDPSVLDLIAEWVLKQ